MSILLRGTPFSIRLATPGLTLKAGIGAPPPVVESDRAFGIDGKDEDAPTWAASVYVLDLGKRF